VIGQILGGVLVTADIAGSGWRPIFLINVPICALALVAAGRCRCAQESGRTNLRRSDFAVCCASLTAAGGP